MSLATDPEAERAQHEESQYQQCLSWIKQQSGDFRSRLVKDLAEWEKTLPTESQSSEPPDAHLGARDLSHRMGRSD